MNGDTLLSIHIMIDEEILLNMSLKNKEDPAVKNKDEGVEFIDFEILDEVSELEKHIKEVFTRSISWSVLIR